MEKTNADYNILPGVKFSQLELIDTNKIVSENKEKWINFTLTKVNNSLVRLAIIEGDFHWHKHDNEDEFFFVLEGKLLMDIEENGIKRTVELNPMQGITISKGVMHCPRAPQKTVIMLFENDGIVSTGD
ncbi:MAG: cupin domain-containing protein [Ignavibacteria bacterium]|nr:cupin domain-containing protein [Ignavibacteria bacterium]